MIKFEKINNKLVLTTECNHSIVDDCFLFASMNAPSEGKRLLMEVVGEAYEKYVKSLASENNIKYLEDEFAKIKITDN
jgi:hypothetical protein